MADEGWVMRVDRAVTGWMARHGLGILRVSLGVVFLWFGMLKFFTEASPAEDLAGRTIEVMTFGMMQKGVSLPVLAVWECLIGLGLMAGVWMRVTLLLLFLQMAGTLMPLVLFYRECFAVVPWVPTLVGQYIVKNLVLISAGVVLGGTVRGGALVEDADLAKEQREREEGR